MDEGNTRKYVSSWEKYLFLNTDDTENYYLFLGDVFSILNFVCLLVCFLIHTPTFAVQNQEK